MRSSFRSSYRLKKVRKLNEESSEKLGAHRGKLWSNTREFERRLEIYWIRLEFVGKWINSSRREL